jgi:hypothetical protein
MPLVGNERSALFALSVVYGHYPDTYVNDALRGRLQRWLQSALPLTSWQST